jgi:hypothetical protein
MKFKLGRLPVKSHPKTLMLSKYLSTTLPDPIEKVYREYKTPDAAKQMFGNDNWGDCTCAGAANKFIHDSCHTGTVLIPTEAEVLALYSAVTGFDPNAGPPGNNPTDNGAAMTDVLAYLQSTGMTIGGQVYKILGWAQIDSTNLAHRQLGCQLFGGTYVGVNLPASADSQFVEGQQCNWEVVPGSQIEGGHCIFRPGYGSEGDDYVTWANWFVKASAAWSSTYVEEEYVLITEQWFNQATQETPGGLDLTTLEADLAAIKQ